MFLNLQSFTFSKDDLCTPHTWRPPANQTILTHNHLESLLFFCTSETPCVRNAQVIFIEGKARPENQNQPKKTNKNTKTNKHTDKNLQAKNQQSFISAHQGETLLRQLAIWASNSRLSCSLCPWNGLVRSGQVRTGLCTVSCKRSARKHSCISESTGCQFGSLRTKCTPKCSLGVRVTLNLLGCNTVLALEST